jgi:urease accessory protein
MGSASITACVSANGRTVLAKALAASPVRIVEPTFPGTRAAAVCVATFGGGLVDGDRIDLDVTVEPGAVLVLFTQASTKVFRGSSSQHVSARVAGTLVFLPDPVAAFADATFVQRIDVALDGDAARAVLLDGFTSGRAAFGDRWAMRRIDLRTVVTRAGRTLVRDATCLDRADGDIASRCGRFDAFATVLAFDAPSIAADLTASIPPPAADLALAASPLPRASGAIFRAAAPTPARALGAVRARLRNLPDIDAVDPFASRY